MRRAVPCFSATDDNLVASGLQPDRHSLKQALWEAAEGVYFAAGMVRRKKPAALAFNTSGSPIRGIGQLHASDGGRWLWTGEDNNIWRWQFGAPELIDGAYGVYRAQQLGTLQPTIYDFTSYGNWMIVNDGIAPKIHKPEAGTPWQDFAGEVPQAVVRYMKKANMVMALGYGIRGTQVGWCDPDDITTWTAADTNLAGSLAIDEFDTPIRAGERLADNIAVYAEDQMALVRYLGSPFMFGQKLSIDGIGAIGKAAVASDTRVNVGVGRNGIWWTDGIDFRYIDEGFLKNYLQDNVNWTQGGLIVAMRNDATGCFEFHFPMGVSNTIDEAWSWDPRTGGWSPAVAASFKVERKLFGYPLVGTNAGVIQYDDNDFALASTLVLRTRPLTLSLADGSQLGTHIVSRVDELELLLQEASNVEVRVGCSDDVNGDWDWTTWYEVETGNRIIELEHLPEQPLWKVEFRNVPGVNDWRLNLQGFFLYGPDIGTKMEA